MVSNIHFEKLLGRIAAFLLHTFLVYASALYVSPWLVGRAFAWVVPLMGFSQTVQPSNAYLQHLELVTLIPAFVLGYCNLIQFCPSVVRSYVAEPLGSVGIWAWVLPTVILGYKMLVYHAPSSVFYGSSASVVRYFFVIHTAMPTPADFRGGDPVQVLAQMTVTAPFYASIGYALGALALKNRLLHRLLALEKRDVPADQTKG